MYDKTWCAVGGAILVNSANNHEWFLVAVFSVLIVMVIFRD